MVSELGDTNQWWAIFEAAVEVTMRPRVGWADVGFAGAVQAL